MIMKEKEIKVITYPCNLTLLSKKQVEEILKNNFKNILEQHYKNNEFKIKSSNLDVRRTDINELAYFSGSMTFNLSVPESLNIDDLTRIKKKLDHLLTMEQVRIRIIPILTITEVEAPYHKEKKNRVDIRLTIKIGYRTNLLSN